MSDKEFKIFFADYFKSLGKVKPDLTFGCIAAKEDIRKFWQAATKATDVFFRCECSLTLFEKICCILSK